MRLKFSAIGITDMKGTSGGSSIQGAKGGAILRRRVVPTNVRSNAQVTQRAAFSQQAQAWRALTEAQRDAWRTWAKSGEKTFKTLLGDTFQGSGSQAYAAVNNSIIAAWGSPISSPPLLGSLGDTVLESASASVTGPSLEVGLSGAVADGEALVIFATAGGSPGKGRATNLKKVFVATSGDGASIEMQGDYSSAFGALAAGTKIFIEAKLVSQTTGSSRQAGSLSVIVGA
jgi:hypothetical protein